MVTCDLGDIASAASADVVISVQAPSTAGLAVNLASVSTLPPTLEINPANDSSSETTDVRGANIGDVVRLDNDGNRVQDEGEATIPHVAVLLYNGAGDLLDSAETNHSLRPRSKIAGPQHPRGTRLLDQAAEYDKSL